MSVRRYVVMANGKGRRWGNYGGKPKHLIEIGGETLLARTARLVRERDPDADLVISSSDARCCVAGVRRHEPKRNEFEIDRFAYELVCDDVCFLYGDTYYSKKAIETIAAAHVRDMLFFGDSRTVFAVRTRFAETMRRHVDEVRNLYAAGEIDACKGWQLYQAYAGLPIGPPCTGRDFVLVEDETRDFNAPQDLLSFLGDAQLEGHIAPKVAPESDEEVK